MTRPDTPEVTAEQHGRGGISGEVGLWSVAHGVDDFFQALVPSMVPFLVAERGLSYTAASSLVLAATLGSALPQVPIGLLVDRHRVRWLAPVGIATASAGVGAAALAGGYVVTFVLLVVSGLGVACFHPPAGRAVRAATASPRAMGWFAAGGGAGFALAPAMSTPVMERWGAAGAVCFVPVALTVAVVLGRRHRPAPEARTRVGSGGPDHHGLFALLTLVEVVRSVVSFGVATFLPLHWLVDLHSSGQTAGLALTAFLTGSLAGTVLGGRLGATLGPVRTVQLGNVLLTPTLAAVLLSPGGAPGLVAAAAAGTATGIPFAVLVALGQDYLPGRPGTASGVTLGVAVSAGGLALPLLGALADRTGPHAVLLVLAALPVAALALSFGLRPPDRSSG